MKRKSILYFKSAALLLCCITLFACSKEKVNYDEVRRIAKESYIYGYPMADHYRIMYAYWVDEKNPEYKGKINTIVNIPRVYTPNDKAIQTPNSDTPYSMLWLDLRAEPMVLTFPEIEKERYFSVMLVDMYTHDFDYIGSRATGNGGGNFLVAGPGWKGETPKGIKKVIRCESELAMAVCRTQLFNPSDLENVKKVQSEYKIQTLSDFLGKEAPKQAPKIDFIKPLDKKEMKTSPEIFNIINFTLGFGPVHPSEKELMMRFEKIGVGAGKKIDFANMAPEMKAAYENGIKDAWKEYEDFYNNEVLTGKVTSGDLFGTREYLKNNYMYRMSGAILGIYGNFKEEAVYPIYNEDSERQPLDGSKKKYILRFAPGQYPPVNAFWSLTMYKMPESLLLENPINRYLINSPMLPELKKDDDGGLTIYIQKDSPGKDRESNWLPAPDGPFMCAMRIYWPKPEALNGTWKSPLMQPVK